jgi:hypothetical protein
MPNATRPQNIARKDEGELGHLAVTHPPQAIATCLLDSRSDRNGPQGNKLRSPWINCFVGAFGSHYHDIDAAIGSRHY